MWKDSYENVCELEKSFGGKVNEGASECVIDRFAKAVECKLGILLPSELREVYKITMGIEFNGHIFYGIDQDYLENTPNQNIVGLIDMNLTWKTEGNNFNEYLFIAEHDLSWFVYDNELKIYLELDSPSGSKITTFENIDQLLDVFFKRAQQ